MWRCGAAFTRCAVRGYRSVAEGNLLELRRNDAGDSEGEAVAIAPYRDAFAGRGPGQPARIRLLADTGEARPSCSGACPVRGLGTVLNSLNRCSRIGYCHGDISALRRIPCCLRRVDSVRPELSTRAPPFDITQVSTMILVTTYPRLLPSR